MKTSAFTFPAKVYNIESSIPGTLNPCVEVPDNIVEELHTLAGRERGPVQVKCELKKHVYDANVVKYKGAWRLYLHGIMRKETGIEVGDTIRVVLKYDPEPRMPPTPKEFSTALAENKPAKNIWKLQPRSRRKEVLLYLNGLKTKVSLMRNVDKVIAQLMEKANKK